MPPTTVVFFQEDGGTAPVAMWLDELRRTEPRAFARVAVLLHALTKEDVVPDDAIDLAVARKDAFARDPDAHPFRGPLP